MLSVSCEWRGGGGGDLMAGWWAQVSLGIGAHRPAAIYLCVENCRSYHFYVL